MLPATFRRKALTQEISWERFCYQFIETGYFDHEDRPKTARAMRVFWERCPKRSMRKIMRMSLGLFAPTPHVYGTVLLGSPGGEKLIYFAPDMEKCSQSRVNITVAHEFAHALLGHGVGAANIKLPQGKQKEEQEADNLIKKWGYRAAYRCNQ